MDFGETISFHSTPKIMELDMVSQDILAALNHHCDIENTVEQLREQCDAMRISIDLYQSGSIEFSDLLNVIQSKPIPTNTWEDPNAEQFINYLHIIKWLHNTAAHEKIFNTLLTKILTIAKPGKYPLYEEANRNF
jgi:hypothetical protein